MSILTKQIFPSRLIAWTISFAIFMIILVIGINKITQIKIEEAVIENERVVVLRTK